MSDFIVQSIGVIALIVNVFAFASRTRNHILTRQGISALFFTIHFFLLGAYTGAAMNLIVIIRNWVFEHKRAHAWARHTLWLGVFMLTPVAALLFSWQGPISLFPVVGTCFAVYGLWHNNARAIRIWILAATIIWTPYLIVMHSYPGLLNQFFTAGAVLFGMYEGSERVTRKKVPSMR